MNTWNVTYVACLLAAVLLAPCARAADGTAGRGEAPAAKGKALDVYLLIGQSNMAGRAAIEDRDKAPLERCFLLNASDQWEPATNPLNRYSTIRKSLGMQKLGPGWTFAGKMLKSDPKLSLGLVVNAKGGTKIEQWAKGAKFYGDAVRRAKAAQSAGGVLKGILWHQGEGNRDDGEYLTKLTKLVEDFRKDLKAPKLLFVVGQIAGKGRVNGHLAKLPKALPLTGCASTKGLKPAVHFDAPDMRTLGQRYADEVIRIQTQAKRPSW